LQPFDATPRADRRCAPKGLKARINLLKVYMELSSYFLFLQEQIKDIIIINF